MYRVRTFNFFFKSIFSYFLLSSRERARRHQVQTSSNILARILINGKVTADTSVVYDNIDFPEKFKSHIHSFLVH